MAKKYTKTETKERNCRKKMATLLSLMGFHDDDLENTIKIMRRKLIEIQEKEEAKNKKELSTNIKKVTFKLAGKTTSSLIRLQTLTNNFSVVVVPKKKRSNIKRLPNYKFCTKTSLCSSSSDDDDQTLNSNNIMEIDDDDSRYYVMFAEKMINYVSDQSFEEKRFKMHVMNNDNENGDVNPNYEMIVIDDNDNNVMDLTDFIRNMGGLEPELMFEKRLTVSDVTKGHGRLLMPVLQVKNPDFLTIDEKIKLANEENLSVWVFDPERRKSTLNFGLWKMRANENYVLKKQWNQIVSVNGFTDNVVIQVLSFRVEERLCFALVRV